MTEPQPSFNAERTWVQISCNMNNHLSYFNAPSCLPDFRQDNRSGFLCRYQEVAVSA